MSAALALLRAADDASMSALTIVSIRADAVVEAFDRGDADRLRSAIDGLRSALAEARGANGRLSDVLELVDPGGTGGSWGVHDAASDDTDDTAGLCANCGGSGGGMYPAHCTSCRGTGRERERDEWPERDDCADWPSWEDRHA